MKRKFVKKKEFTPEEVRGYMIIDGKRVTYLKTGVKRVARYQDHIEEDMMKQMDQNLIALDRYTEYLKKVVGMDDFDDKQ